MNNYFLKSSKLEIIIRQMEFKQKLSSVIAMHKMYN